jgi:hypothetical protein
MVSSMSTYIGPAVDVAPRNQFSFAIYTDVGGAPGGLVAQSGTGTVSGGSWNTLPIIATLQANTVYWLFYNSNGSNGSVNNMTYNDDPGPVGAYAARTFGTWPATYGPTTLVPTRYAIFVSGT